MQPEVQTEAQVSVQGSVDVEAAPEMVGEPPAKDTGPAAYAVRLLLVGSEMTLDVMRKPPFVC